MTIETHTVKGNGFFGVLEDPKSHKQHPNQQNGLDLYIKLINFESGEVCLKKLYQNKKGLHFKHSVSHWSSQDTKGVHYLSEFTKDFLYVPFQIMEANA